MVYASGNLPFGLLFIVQLTGFITLVTAFGIVASVGIIAMLALTRDKHSVLDPFFEIDRLLGDDSAVRAIKLLPVLTLDGEGVRRCHFLGRLPHQMVEGIRLRLFRRLLCNKTQY